MTTVSKGTWENGDIEVIKIVYKGKEVTKEELKRIVEEEKKNGIRK